MDDRAVLTRGSRYAAAEGWAKYSGDSWGFDHAECTEVGNDNTCSMSSRGRRRYNLIVVACTEVRCVAGGYL